MEEQSGGLKRFLIGRYGSLLVILLLVFVIQPWVHTPVGKYGIEFLLVGALFAGLRAIAIWNTARRFLIVLMLMSIACLALGTVFNRLDLYTAGTAGRVVFLASVVLIILYDLFRSRRVTGDTLAGAVCVYLLIAVIWTSLFLLVEFFIPASFTFTQGHFRESMWMSKEFFPFFYFSLVTMTTVGYGDMAPISSVARTLAALEAITGQIYLTILVARLVGMHLASCLKEEPD